MKPWLKDKATADPFRASSRNRVTSRLGKKATCFHQRIIKFDEIRAFLSSKENERTRTAFVFWCPGFGGWISKTSTRIRKTGTRIRVGTSMPDVKKVCSALQNGFGDQGGSMFLRYIRGRGSRSTGTLNDKSGFGGIMNETQYSDRDAVPLCPIFGIRTFVVGPIVR